MWIICLYQGGEAWRIGIPVVTAVSASLFIQLTFPVVVPIRYGDFGREVPVRLIRMELMESTDKVNGLLYNGLPSNHLGMIITGVWICLTIYSTDNWFGWVIIALVLGFFALLFMFTVLYLGEHYWQDLVAAIVVYSVVLIITKGIIDSYF